MAPTRKYIPEDKDQALVRTPYGRGLVIRSNRDDSIREVLLTEWEMASSRRGVTGNAMLYSCQKFPSVKPLLGDDVTCLWGRGVVQKLRIDGTVVVRLSSWRLANRCLVKCHLNVSEVQVVRKKTRSEMDVYERVELAEEFKALANKQFTQKFYEPAVITYSKAVDAVRYVQHDSNSSNEVRADLVVAMITCSNNAGTCSIHLHKWDDAMKFAQQALVLVDALYLKRGSKIHRILNKDGYADSKLFGEWRVKSYLIMARAYFERKDYDKALEKLVEATAILDQYDEKTATLMSQEKEVKKLKAHSEREEKAVRKMEKKRARAMFGGGSTSNNLKVPGHSTNDIISIDAETEMLPRAAVPDTPVTLKSCVLKFSEPVGDSGDASESNEGKTLPSKLAKKVSFSVPEADEFEDEETPWYSEHVEAFILTAAIGVIAIGIGVLFGNRKR